MTHKFDCLSSFNWIILKKFNTTFLNIFSPVLVAGSLAQTPNLSMTRRVFNLCAIAASKVLAN